MAYYESKYSGEEIDAAVDTARDPVLGNEALKALIDALAARVAALEAKP